VYPIVVILLDGLGDRAHAALGGRTGVEAAATPNLDRLAASGSCGVLYSVGPGRAPSSDVAHWAMFGYGRGQDVDDEHVFAYAALRPAERRDDGWWLTGRPHPERDAEEAGRLVERCDGVEVDGLRFSLAHVWRGEAVCRISGGGDDRVTDTDAFFRAWYPVLRPRPVVPEAVPVREGAFVAATGRVSHAETSGPRLFIEDLHVLGGRDARASALAVAVEHRRRDASPTPWARG
jgi:2,3-bisphosphoglycerate-independent phosphoglycerate mutase